LIDRPPVHTSTVKVLRDAFAGAGDETWVVIPEFGGKHGHPMVIGREMIEEFLRAGAESSARDVLAGLRERVRYVPVDDPFVALNINTPQEYEELRLRR
jgi:molybdenum cofactor cytidylyltransferase